MFRKKAFTDYSQSNVGAFGICPGLLSLDKYREAGKRMYKFMGQIPPEKVKMGRLCACGTKNGSAKGLFFPGFFSLERGSVKYL